MSEIGKWLFPTPAQTRSKLRYALQIINVEYLSGLVDFLSGFPLPLDTLYLVI
jgi:hypothetical protein